MKKVMTKERFDELADKVGLKDDERPRTRADCKDVPRPCPYVGCKYNTYLDIKDDGTILAPDYPPWEANPKTSCVLDVADGSLGRPITDPTDKMRVADVATLDEIGQAIGVTRERTRQVIDNILAKLKKSRRDEAKRLRSYR